jgi:hypothetical protein
MGGYAREKAWRYSWPSVASEVVDVYNEAREVASLQPARGTRKVEVTNVHNTV